MLLPDLIFCLQEHVCVGSDSRFLYSGTKHRSISVGDSTLWFRITCQKVVPAAKNSKISAGAVSSSASELAAAAQKIVKTRQFPGICSFNVLADRSFALSDSLGAHVRICSDPALLHIGSEFEICAADAADCFGQIVFCSQPSTEAAVDEEAAVCTVHIKVAMIYLPCSPLTVHGTLSEVFHVFVKDSPELKSEIESRKAAAATKLAETDKIEHCYAIYQDLKDKALAQAQVPFLLNSDEFGMVALRRCFLESQKLMSKILACLMKRDDWYGHASEQQCAVVFDGSHKGPWDIFKIIKFLIEPFDASMQRVDKRRIFDLTVTALYPHVSNPVEKDSLRANLHNILNAIYNVRNWWAHHGAAESDCRKARQMINLFFKEVYEVASEDLQSCITKEDILNIDGVDRSLALGLSVHDVAYVIFGRIKLELCDFCLDISVRLPNINFSKKLNVALENKLSKTNNKYGSIEISEVFTVIKDIADSSSTIRYDCDRIKSCRNYLSHATGVADQVILVLVALSSVVRIIDFLMTQVDEMFSCPFHPNLVMESFASSLANIENTRSDLLKHGKFYRDSVVAKQAELLARCNVFDMSQLICEFFQSKLVSQALDRSPFLHHTSHSNRAIEQHRSLQLLLVQKVAVPLQEIVGHVFTKDTKQAGVKEEKSEGQKSEGEKSEKSEINSLFYLIAHMPLSLTESLDQALDWLLRTEDAGTPDLLQCFGPSVLVGYCKQKFSDHRGCDESGYDHFLKFCQSFNEHQEQNLTLQRRKKEYFEACRKSPNIFGKAEADMKSRIALVSSEAEEWAERTRLLDASTDDLHRLHEISKSIYELLNKPTSHEVSVDTVKAFLKRCALLYC